MNMRLVFFFTAFLLLACVNFYALEFDLYDTVPLFDIPMHFLGGVVIALGISILPFIRITLPKSFTSFQGYLALFFLIGCIWEVFELWAGATYLAHPDFVSDTTLDFIVGGLGTVVGYVWVTQLKKIESWHI